MDDLYNSIIALNPSSQMILKDGIVTNNTTNTLTEQQQYKSQTALLENALNNIEGYQNYYCNYNIIYIAIVSVIIIYLISKY